MRHYGFSAEEIAAASTGGMLDLAIDPKLAWALKHRDRFPVDVNRAEREALLRVPGLGVRSVDRILASRRHRTLRLDDLSRLAASTKKLLPFVIAADHRPGRPAESTDLRNLFAAPAEQLTLFS
jgi:predicted DNA-binding helix-hairpin-helix protein